MGGEKHAEAPPPVSSFEPVGRTADRVAQGCSGAIEVPGVGRRHDGVLRGSSWRRSTPAGRFAAGILQHCRAITALTASSVVSYQRLTPHRWSAGHAFLGEQNREAMLRICPLVEVEGKNRAA